MHSNHQFQRKPTELEKMSKNRSMLKSKGHACAVTRIDGKDVIVVAGGYKKLGELNNNLLKSVELHYEGTSFFKRGKNSLINKLSVFSYNERARKINPFLSSLLILYLLCKTLYVSFFSIRQFKTIVCLLIRYPCFILNVLQANLCQKLLFLHQLTHNMTTDCSLNYEFNS